MIHKNKLLLLIISCMSFLLVSGLMYSANHFYQKGEMYQTGNIVCQNDDRGPCGYEYKENLNELQLPEWVIFFKGNGGFLAFLVTLIFCITAYIVYAGLYEIKNINEQLISDKKTKDKTTKKSSSIGQMIDEADDDGKRKIYNDIQKYYGLSDDIMFGKKLKK